MVPGGKAEGDLSRWSQDNEATWGTRMTEAEGAIMRGTQDIEATSGTRTHVGCHLGQL